MNAEALPTKSTQYLPRSKAFDHQLVLTLVVLGLCLQYAFLFGLDQVQRPHLEHPHALSIQLMAIAAYLLGASKGFSWTFHPERSRNEKVVLLSSAAYAAILVLESWFDVKWVPLVFVVQAAAGVLACPITLLPLYIVLPALKTRAVAKMGTKMTTIAALGAVLTFTLGVPCVVAVAAMWKQRALCFHLDSVKALVTCLLAVCLSSIGTYLLPEIVGDHKVLYPFDDSSLPLPK